MAGTGTGNIASFTAVNTGAAMTSGTITVTPTAATCAGSAKSFTINVNPTPIFNSSLTPPAICNNSIFNYSPSSPTAGTTFTWARAAQTDIANIPATGIDNPAEVLVNMAFFPVDVIYNYTLSANGCTNTQNVIIRVNPTPMLASPLSMPAICNNTVFSYIPSSLTSGTTFSWSRGTIPGILNAPATGTNNPNEALTNVTANPITVTYVYILSANGCHNMQNVTVTVNPTPVLSTPLTASICSGDSFSYIPASSTAGTVFIWNRPAVAGITPATNSGVGKIAEKLLNSTSQSIDVTYVYTNTANGCTNAQNVVLTVKPTPVIPQIVVKSPHDVCSKTLYQNFGAATPPPAGSTYDWWATNATIWNQNSDKQNVLINFYTPGTTVVTLTTTGTVTSCKSTDTYIVTVGKNTSADAEVIYYNSRFICLKNNMDIYRWGYDDKTTLDSTIIPNETNQDYLNTSPDFTNKYYWVMTVKNGCLQKNYYNKPTGVVNTLTNDAELKVYPNPATTAVNVEIGNYTGKNMQLNMFDLAGRMLKNVPVTQAKTQIDIAELPQGVYLISVYENGVKVGVSRFVKN